MMWVAAATYCATLAPKGLLATLIGVIGMAHFSIGKSVLQDFKNAIEYRCVYYIRCQKCHHNAVWRPLCISNTNCYKPISLLSGKIDIYYEYKPRFFYCRTFIKFSNAAFTFIVFLPLCARNEKILFSGRGSGSFVGGHIIAKYEIRNAFKLMGLVALISGFAYAVIQYGWLRKREKNEVVEEGTNSFLVVIQK